GRYEATQAMNLYDFYFVYNDGSYYYGTVADNGPYGYHSSVQANTSYGYYYIYNKESTATSRAVGSVQAYYYYDRSNGTGYTPYYAGIGSNDGSSGLGSEYDYTYALLPYTTFFRSGRYEATQAMNLYDFYFVYNDGSY